MIKRQLRHLLPGIRVFLDVDDLTDISLLETYIERSASIVIFLSKVHARRTAHALCTPLHMQHIAHRLSLPWPCRATSTRAIVCGR